MECPNELNLGHGTPCIICETQVEIRVVGEGEGRHRMLHRGSKKLLQDPELNQSL